TLLVFRDAQCRGALVFTEASTGLDGGAEPPRIGSGAGLVHQAQVFIDSKNSALFLVLRSLSSRKSMASMVPIGLRMRRRTYIFLSCCGSVSSSSLRVPERVMS